MGGMVHSLGHTIHPLRTKTLRLSGPTMKHRVLLLCPPSGRDGCHWRMSVARRAVSPRPPSLCATCGLQHLWFRGLFPRCAVPHLRSDRTWPLIICSPLSLFVSIYDFSVRAASV